MTRKLAVFVIAALLCMACAGAEALDFSQYPDYTGAPLEDSAQWIADIMTSCNIRAKLEPQGTLKRTTYAGGDGAMSVESCDSLVCMDGAYVRHIEEGYYCDIYVAGDTAYMIENGAIYTTTASAIPGLSVVVDDFIFVYDEAERIYGVRDMENGVAVLSCTEDLWLEYFLDQDGFICAVKMYEGAENPELINYNTIEYSPETDVPSFILRELAD